MFQFLHISLKHYLIIFPNSYFPKDKIDLKYQGWTVDSSSFEWYIWHHLIIQSSPSYLLWPNTDYITTDYYPYILSDFEVQAQLYALSFHLCYMIYSSWVDPPACQFFISKYTLTYYANTFLFRPSCLGLQLLLLFIILHLCFAVLLDMPWLSVLIAFHCIHLLPLETYILF